MKPGSIALRPIFVLQTAFLYVTWQQHPIRIFLSWKEHRARGLAVQVDVVARCTTGPRRAANNASRNLHEIGEMHHELWRIDIVNQGALLKSIFTTYIVARCVTVSRRASNNALLDRWDAPLSCEGLTSWIKVLLKSIFKHTLYMLLATTPHTRSTKCIAELWRIDLASLAVFVIWHITQNVPT